MMEADIKQTLTLIIRRITNESTAVVYSKYMSLFEALTYKLSILSEPTIDMLNKEIEMLFHNIFFDNYIYALSDNFFKIGRLKDWLYSVFQNQDQVDYFMKDIMPAHIKIYFDNQNSDKSCNMLYDRIIKEIERVYKKLDEFEESTLRLNLTSTSYEHLIKILKRLKRIVGVNPDLIPLQYFLLNILDF